MKVAARSQWSRAAPLSVYPVYKDRQLVVARHLRPGFAMDEEMAREVGRPGQFMPAVAAVVALVVRGDFHRYDWPASCRRCHPPSLQGRIGRQQQDA